MSKHSQHEAIQPSPLGPIGGQRLYSLDALRGFDMFWIMGAEEIFHTLAEATGSPALQAISNQLTHPAWNGFHFYDLIFPLFLFMAGVATPYSVGRELEKGNGRKKVLLRVIRRGLILVLLGIFHNNGLHIKPLADIRFGSVLGRIGIAYMFANIIFIYCKRSNPDHLVLGTDYRLLASSEIYVCTRFPHGDLTMEGNFASYIDRSILPGKLYLGIHDPEGLMSTIPAISTGLLGILAGTFLKTSPHKGSRKAFWLAVTGIAFILLALIWNLDFPINKNLWTSSFVCLVGGISLCFYRFFIISSMCWDIKNGLSFLK